MNIKGFYIPDRPFCIICGFESDEGKEIQEHVEEMHPKYHAAQCGAIPPEEGFKELRKSRILNELLLLINQLNKEQRDALFSIGRIRLDQERFKISKDYWS